MVAFYLDNTFVYDHNIFTKVYICQYVEQMFLYNIFFDCEIWTEPSNFGQVKTKNLPTLIVKK